MKVTGLLPANGRPRECEGCNAWIIWAETARGNKIPVEAQLNLAGSLMLWFEVDGQGFPVGDPPVQHVSVVALDYQGPRWMPHLAVCPKATPFRRYEARRGDL